MYTKLNSDENLTELVFENKNKSYGAYAIRKSYQENVTISLASSSALFFLMAWLAVSFTNKNTAIPIIDLINDPIIPTVIADVIIPIPDKPMEREIPKPHTPPKSDSGQMTPSDDPKNTLNKTTDELVISKNPNPDGDSAAKYMSGPVTSAPPSTGDLGGNEKKVTKFPDVWPMMDNMRQFIVDNLKFPKDALRNATSGTVVLSFVVDVDGSISNIQVLNSIGDGCEEEAKRVVGLMPKWKPGKINNSPVAVQCNLPIKFSIK